MGKRCPSGYPGMFLGTFIIVCVRLCFFVLRVGCGLWLCKFLIIPYYSTLRGFWVEGEDWVLCVCFVSQDIMLEKAMNFCTR